ncbi:MAG: cation-transporting P-type ATPase [Rhodocyclaceae bacterium]|nr:cation-transporting P-type ATPase [Rhodocyclaceae bacterium]
MQGAGSLEATKRPSNETVSPWWLESPAEAAAQSGSRTTGLSSAEATARLARFGPNLLRDHQEQPLWLQFLTRFKNPLVSLLRVESK